jgi:succinate dehydrogenase / fumarate reductase iron-sulfur subunit
VTAQGTPMRLGAGGEVVLRVFRGDRAGGREEEYHVPTLPGMVVLDAIHWIQANADPTLAVRWNCKAARCGSCSAEVNGRPRLLCKTRVEEFGNEDIRVWPMKAFPIVKDLVCDVSWNYEVNEKIQAFTPSEPGPFVMYEEDVDRVREYRKCIECFLCQDVCHVLRDHVGHSKYFGPRFMVRIAALEMHPKDAADRTAQLHGEGGIAYCNITKCCEELCPEHIHITDNAIIPLKERVADQRYDPLRWAIRRITGR